MARPPIQTLNPRQIPAQVSHFEEFAARMRDAGQPELAIRNLQIYYDQLLPGATGFIDHHEARPALGIPDYEELADRYATAGEEALAPHGSAQAQRRPGHQHGHEWPQVAAARQGWA